jgi:hypothetical protein
VDSLIAAHGGVGGFIGEPVGRPNIQPSIGTGRHYQPDSTLARTSSSS